MRSHSGSANIFNHPITRNGFALYGLEELGNLACPWLLTRLEIPQGILQFDCSQIIRMLESILTDSAHSSLVSHHLRLLLIHGLAQA